MRKVQQTIKACRHKAQAHIYTPIRPMREFLDLKDPFQQTKGCFNQKATVPVAAPTDFDGNACILVSSHAKPAITERDRVSEH